MLAHLSRHGSDPRTMAGQAGARLRRITAVLAAVTCAVLAWAAAALAAAAIVMLIYRARATHPMQNVFAPAAASAHDNPELAGSDQIQFL